CCDRAGRVLVEPDLSLPGHPEVFVIGDLAALKDESGKWLPGVAPTAIQQGKFVAKTIARDLAHEQRKNFKYWDKGSLATIGRAAAVAQFGKIHISGFVAWLAWLFVHIFFLIGFRNRHLGMSVHSHEFRGGCCARFGKGTTSVVPRKFSRRGASVPEVSRPSGRL